MQVNLDNIPQELRDHKGWLVWKFIKNKESKKPLKIPFYVGTKKWRKGHAHGAREDRQQLVHFDKAAKLYSTHDEFTGLGLAMLSDWNLVAADFDDCVEDGKVHPMVMELVKPTYWEISPSGKGVRAFFRGTMRDAKLITKQAKERGLPFGVEFFNSKGFVTVTGNNKLYDLIDPEIVPITDELKAFFDEYFGSRNVSMKNDTQPPVGATDEEIAKMLEQWDATCDYQTWLNVGMAIHHETDGAGFDLWHEWSSTGANYASFEECQYKWESFGHGHKNSVKTLRWMLHEKPIDFELENVAKDDFNALPKKVDSKGNVVRPMPKFFGMNNDGEIPPSAENVKAAVEREDVIGLEFRKDNFIQETMLQPYGADNKWRRIEEEDYFGVQMRLDRLAFKNASMEKVRNAVAFVARDNGFDSAVEWLENVVPEWDGVERIHEYAEKFLGAVEDEAYVRAVSVYAWTAHAGRILEPGVKADMMPVLIGKEGRGKSSNIQAISPGPKYFTVVSFTQDNKEIIENTVGTLVAECAEMDGLSKRDTNALKGFLTTQVDSVRRAYRRDTEKLPRRYLMWGTTNDRRFLSDPTENRRFLPMYVEGSGDLRFGHEDMLQHWAEAREKFKANKGVLCAEEANELAKPYRVAARVIDPWQEEIEDAIAENRVIGDDGTKMGEATFLKTKDLWRDVLCMSTNSINAAASKRLANSMKSLGYEQRRGTGGVRGWHKAEELTCNEITS